MNVLRFLFVGEFDNREPITLSKKEDQVIMMPQDDWLVGQKKAKRDSRDTRIM